MTEPISYKSLVRPIITIAREGPNGGDWYIKIGAYKNNYLIGWNRNLHRDENLERMHYIDFNGDIIHTNNKDITHTNISKDRPYIQVYKCYEDRKRDNYVYAWLNGSWPISKVIYICYKLQDYIKKEAENME